MTKNGIRNSLKEKREQLQPKEQEAFSKAIRERLFQSEAYHRCTRLFAFASFQSEVDTFGIIKQSLAEGKEVFLPKVKAKDMVFYRIEGLQELIRSSYGILEPVGRQDGRESIGKEEELINEKGTSNLMLMPGLAFDVSGNRIGYGAGYYDRFLAKYPKSTFYKVALAYDFQIMEEIPAEAYDQRVDVIITPTRRVECGISQQ